MPTWQPRTCQAAACSKPVPLCLSRQGVCLGHHLDAAFTRVAQALHTCQQGQPIDASTIDWMTEQGDLAVKLLSQKNVANYSEDRAKLLELLLCLANVQEYVRHHSVAGPF